MTFINKALNAFTFRRPAAKSEAEAIVQLIQSGETHDLPRADAKKVLALYSKHPWVRSIVGKVAKRVARSDWYLEDGDGERITEHPALEFIRAGCPKLRGSRARATAQAQYDLSGETFWIVGRENDNPNGKPFEWAPVPSNFVTDTPDGEDGFYTLQIPNGTVWQVPAKDVIYFRDADPLEPYERGRGLTGAAYTEIATDEAASEYLHSFLKNRARPDFILTGETMANGGSTMSRDDADRLTATFMERFRGAMRAGRPLITPGKLNVIELSNKLRDNQIHEVRQQLKEVITEIYGIPPEMLGRISNSNRSTIDVADFMFAKHTIDPRLAETREELVPFLEREFGLKKAGLTLRYENPVEEDKEFALKVAIAKPSAFTKNELREMAGKRPVKGKDFDEFPEEPEIEPSANDNGDEPDPEDDPPKGSDKKDDKSTPAPVEKEAPAPVEKEAPAPVEKEAPKIVEKSMSPEGIVYVSDAINDPLVVLTINRFVDNIVGDLLERYGAELLEELDAEANFEINGRTVDWLVDEVPSLMGYVNETTRKDLRSSLIEGVAVNETIEELVKRVEAIFDAAADVRAPIIGQTMATKITGFTTVEAAKQAGFEEKKWLSSQDQVVRDTHSAMNGQIKRLDEPFKSPNGGNAMHPGGFGEASEDVNCRCAVRPIAPGEEKALKLDDESFAKWQAAKSSAIAAKVSATVKNVFTEQKTLALRALRKVNETP